MALNSTSSKEKLIQLGSDVIDKNSAIEAVGKLLIDAGAVDEGYVNSMLGRENVANTWLGSGVAIPHGMVEDKDLVKEDAVAVLQVPKGVDWGNGEVAYLIFGIAAKGEGHLNTLRQLTKLLRKPIVLEKLIKTNDKHDVVEAVFNGNDGAQDEAAANLAPVKDYAICEEWSVDYPNGLHARPASVWIDAARASKTKLQARNGNVISDIKSLVSLLELNAKAGDIVVFSAADDDGADNARQDLQTFIKAVKGLTASEKQAAEKAALKKAEQAMTNWVPPSGKTPIIGVSASPGLAIGAVYKVSSQNVEVADIPVSIAQGGPILQHAIETTRAQMKALVDDVTRRLGANDAAIFSAQSELLDDESLIAATCRHMVEGHGVAWSWSKAIHETAERLKSSSNPLLAARSADLLDVGRRVLGQIDPALATGSLSDLPEGGVIIIADDLSPSDTAGLVPGRVIAIATALGGPTSHTAILARTLGLPAVVAAGPSLLDARDGQFAIIDGNGGGVWFDPDSVDQNAAKAEIEKIAKEQEKQKAERGLPATTLDDYTIDIAANINQPEQVPLALSQGAEGVGLMRTEFLFLERGDTPDEDEQYATYRAMLDALGDKPLIVRALDIGGDKQVAHLDLPHEENPFLGVRGARLLLRRPDLLYPQLRALYRAAKDGGNLSIMFPMIMSLDEVLALKERAEEIRQSIGAPSVPLGIMIEVPAAAIMADVLAEHVDFFSIGTNDLTQYTLAVDRQNPDLAASADSLHPSVLRMIDLTVKGAKKYDRWVGVCGGIAGDAYGATLLAGLGVTELSMTPRDIPAVKARFRTESLTQMRQRAQNALQLKTAKEVRALDKKTVQDNK
ncbi:phosphoenolpyruvate--protein phosphotransferase [Bartonella sp. HY406]|uniref:phosphoenolpyruvate--protein phosphotransferase n=1 Tax=Bartonella sp. HY406 TaxID=2979331 RepID=UPI0021C59D50|nr:phosphoenolpyruvate--protein phosphotransferase [Bartonella sp. HY406]UXN02667.1 phosphoenolpyruvate--protein phosphotransferase [Bartonella sp. HY406]